MNTETSTTRARRFVIVGIVVAGVLTAVALTVSSLPSPGPPSARTAPTATPDSSKAPDPPLTAETGIPTVPEPFVPAAPSPGGQRTTSEVEQGASPDQAPLTPPPVAPLAVGDLPKDASELGALVDDFPKALALAPRSSVVSSSVTSSENTMQATLEATTSTGAADVVAFYTELFAAAQLASSPAAAVGGSTAVTFARGSDSLTLTVTPSSDGSRYSLYGVLAIGG